MQKDIGRKTKQKETNYFYFFTLTTQSKLVSVQKNL